MLMNFHCINHRHITIRRETRIMPMMNTYIEDRPNPPYTNIRPRSLAPLDMPKHPSRMIRPLRLPSRPFIPLIHALRTTLMTLPIPSLVLRFWTNHLYNTESQTDLPPKHTTRNRLDPSTAVHYVSISVYNELINPPTPKLSRLMFTLKVLSV